MIVSHYSRKMPNGDFDTFTSEVCHIIQPGSRRTLCGIRHDAPVDGSCSEHGWQLDRTARDTNVTCIRCERKYNPNLH